MGLYEIAVAITILATAVNLACSWLVCARLRKASASNAPAWWTAAQVPAIESCKPRDTILLTADQHFTAMKRAFIREWADEMKAKTGVWLVVLKSGIKTALVRADRFAGLPNASEGDGPITSRVLSRLRKEWGR
jgi:hypothetical protein